MTWNVFFRPAENSFLLLLRSTSGQDLPQLCLHILADLRPRYGQNWKRVGGSFLLIGSPGAADRRTLCWPLVDVFFFDSCGFNIVPFISSANVQTITLLARKFSEIHACIDLGMSQNEVEQPSTSRFIHYPYMSWLQRLVKTFFKRLLGPQMNDQLRWNNTYIICDIIYIYIYVCVLHDSMHGTLSSMYPNNFLDAGQCSTHGVLNTLRPSPMANYYHFSLKPSYLCGSPTWPYFHAKRFALSFSIRTNGLFLDGGSSMIVLDLGFFLLDTSSLLQWFQKMCSNWC